MPNSITPPDGVQEGRAFTVSAFLDFINDLVGFERVFVRGEVGGWKPLPSGVYFCLKDKEDGSILDCYMNPYAYRNLGLIIEDGMEVRVGGAPSVYKPKGRFSFRTETIECVGEGSLKKAYEALKKKLAGEGLFDRKRVLPEFISRIALITSKTGAVIGDFRRNLAPRGLAVSCCDVRVEGATAPDQIIRAIGDVSRQGEDFDVLVVIRGGGSSEDLDVFNNEHVVRAIFGARVPTLVSIGHDRDVPLAQMAADASASTPTATAVLINSSWDRLRTIEQTGRRLEDAFAGLLAGARARLGDYAYRLAAHLGRLTGRGRELEQRLGTALERVGHGIARIRQTLEAAERHLAAANPERLLHLGYSIVTDPAGAVVRSAAQLRAGQVVSTRLAQGSFVSEVQKIDK